MNKKLLLALGSVAAIAAPLVAVVSCSMDSDDDSNNKEQQEQNEAGSVPKTPESHQGAGATNNNHGTGSNNGQRPVNQGPSNNGGNAGSGAQGGGSTNQGPITGVTPNGNGLNLPHLQHRTLASAGATTEANWGLESYSSEFTTKLGELRAMRSGEWAPIGDVVIDIVNDFRFAALEASKHNTAPAFKLKEVINAVPYLADQLKVSTSGLERGKAIAIDSMNAFLNTGNISTTTGLGAGLDGSLNGVPHTRIQPYTQDGSEKDISNMKPVVPSFSAMGWAQYRTQQFEWRGEWDGHAYDRTNAEIQQGRPGANGGQEFVANAPQVWDHPMSENLGVIGRIDAGHGNDGHFSSITPEEAFSASFGLFLDQNDATGTIGHRGNILTSTNRTMGWSVSINKGPGPAMYEQSMIMEFGGSPSNGGPILGGIAFANNQGQDFTGFISENIDASTLPAGFENMDRASKVAALNANAGKIIVLQNGQAPASLTAYSMTASALPEGPYDNISNQAIQLTGKDSTTQATSIYNVLGSGTQALYEDNAYDAWLNN